jgi:dihydrofolate synthase / folylpolyglutamate synthase
MSYDHAVAQLYALGHELAHATSAMFDLAHMRAVLEPLGHPERRFRAILIAGTNGKGSTASTLASIVGAAGHRTGLYTSPHLVRINERIRVNAEEISDPDFADVHQQVEAAIEPLLAAGVLPWHPSFFEVLTAMAFLHFARTGVEVAVLEVGMGGRLDATNVVEPVLSVITDIALDHQRFLGNTVREIAREKAGIIRSGGVVVTLPQHPEANDVIGHIVLERGAQAVNAAAYVPPVSPGAAADNWQPTSGNSYPLSVMDQQIQVQSPLIGRHQLRNVALAIAAAVELDRAGIHISPTDLERGIRQTRWPGRFQVIGGQPEFVLDVAHNPAGAWALRSALSQRYEGRPLLFVFGAMRDKAIAEISEILFPLAERVIATRADNPRSATPDQVRQLASRSGTEILTAETVPEAIALARRLASPDAVVVITGSTFIVGEAMRALRDFCVPR